MLQRIGALEVAVFEQREEDEAVMHAKYGVMLNHGADRCAYMWGAGGPLTCCDRRRQRYGGRGGGGRDAHFANRGINEEEDINQVSPLSFTLASTVNITPPHHDLTMLCCLTPDVRRVGCGGV